MSSGGLLRGRRALVTGAAQGIGAETARRLAEEGACVALADRDRDGVLRQAEIIRGFGAEAYGVHLDVTDDDAVRTAIDDAAGAFGGLDLVVANAGILTHGSAEATSVDSFERVLRVNVCGVYSVFRHSLPHMRAAGGGDLLATASLAGKAGVANLSAYCASKFAVVGLVESLAKELGRDGIRVNAVAPGFVDTAMLDQFTPVKAAATGKSFDETRADLSETIPLGRLISPEEVANALVYLASPMASGISGELLTVSGGGV